jgi:hypothetical protein
MSAWSLTSVPHFPSLDNATGGSLGSLQGDQLGPVSACQGIQFGQEERGQIMSGLWTLYCALTFSGTGGSHRRDASSRGFKAFRCCREWVSVWDGIGKSLDTEELEIPCFLLKMSLSRTFSSCTVKHGECSTIRDQPQYL